eukprot:4482486-Lingulodinium_polyedra.AAC.1
MNSTARRGPVGGTQTPTTAAGQMAHGWRRRGATRGAANDKRRTAGKRQRRNGGRRGGLCG